MSITCASCACCFALTPRLCESGQITVSFLGLLARSALSQASWAVAFFEYCLQVPANRLGHVDHGGPMSVAQLKILQEALTLVVFTIFTMVMMPNEKLRWSDYTAFGLVFAGVAVSVLGRRA